MFQTSARLFIPFHDDKIQGQPPGLDRQQHLHSDPRSSHTELSLSSIGSFVNSGSIRFMILEYWCFYVNSLWSWQTCFSDCYSYPWLEFPLATTHLASNLVTNWNSGFIDTGHPKGDFIKHFSWISKESPPSITSILWSRSVRTTEQALEKMRSC